MGNDIIYSNVVYTLFGGADFSDLSSRWGGARYYSPSMPAQKRTALIEGWKRAIGMLLD